MKKSELKNCFICDDECSDSFKRAHILSRSATMNLIHGPTKAGQSVIHLGNLNGFEFDPKPIGWKTASTEKCFCSIHDDVLFKPIENGNILNTNKKEHLFLHSLRSFAYTFYKKSAEVQPVRGLLDGTKSLFEMFSESKGKFSLENLPSRIDLHLSTYRYMRSAFLETHKNKTYDDFAYRKFIVPEQIPVASAGTLMAQIVPEKGETWTLIQMNPGSPVVHNPALTLTVLPLPTNQTAIIICALKKDKNAMMNLKRFIDLDLDDFLRAITSLMLTSNKDNTFLNPKLWEYLKNINLDQVIRNEINKSRGDDLLRLTPTLSKINLFEPRFSSKNIGL